MRPNRKLALVTGRFTAENAVKSIQPSSRSPLSSVYLAATSGASALALEAIVIPNPIEQIKEEDIQILVTNSVPEGKTIGYERELPGDSELNRREFLAEVSSFANTLGGDLVFGVDKAQGIPSAVVGLTIADMDHEIRKLDGILRTGLQPRIRYDIQPVMFRDGKLVLIVRAERSWLGPHSVVFKSHDKFYGRTSAGKHSLDVSELRTAFGFSQTVVSRIRSFRTDRIIALAKNETPVPLEPGSKLVLHCISFESLGAPRDLDIAQFYTQPDKVWVMNSSAWNHRINSEGFVTFSGGATAGSYTQVFRSGIIEVVDGTTLNLLYEGKRQIPSVSYEHRILEFLPKCFQILHELGTMPPIAVALTLVNVQGLRMGSAGLDCVTSFPIRQNHIISPEAVVNSFDEKPARILKPLFDFVWNACGYPESRNFNAQGDWVQRS